MVTLYIASTKAFAGKTLLAVTLLKDAQQRGQRVQYFKPFGPHPITVDGVTTDKDAMHVAQLLGLQAPPAMMCPVPMTNEFNRQVLNDTLPPVRDKITETFAYLSKDADLVMAAGVGSIFATGMAWGFPAWEVANTLDAHVLLIARHKPDRIVDELLAAKHVLGERLAGVVINDVSPCYMQGIANTMVPYLERHGVTVFGVLPHEPFLHAITARELQEGLNATVLSGAAYLDELVENFAIGAMTTEAAVSHFRKISNKAVITGGDRSDIICAALETSLRALILTGGLDPAPRVLATASQHKVPVLLVREDTLSTVDRIDGLLERLRFRQPQKVNFACELVGKHVDLERLWTKIGVKSCAPT